MRDAHGVDAQLGEYEAATGLARSATPRRSRPSSDVASHVEERAARVQEHDVDADDILAAYISARAEKHTQLRNSRRRRRDEAASENDDLAFAVAALNEVDDDAKERPQH